MKKIVLFLTTVIALMSCGGTNETVLSTGINLSDYKYCVVGTSSIDGSADLADLILKVENFLPEVLTVTSKTEASDLIFEGQKVLTPAINVSSEKRDGLYYTYIAVSFHELKTGKLLAVCKSSGVGSTVKEGRRYSYDHIKKELINSFLRRNDSKKR